MLRKRLHRIFSCKICIFFQNSCFAEHHQATSSEMSNLSMKGEWFELKQSLLLKLQAWDSMFSWEYYRIFQNNRSIVIPLTNYFWVQWKEIGTGLKQNVANAWQVTAQKMKFSIKDFFSKSNQIHSFLWI